MGGARLGLVAITPATWGQAPRPGALRSGLGVWHLLRAPAGWQARGLVQGPFTAHWGLVTSLELGQPSWVYVRKFMRLQGKQNSDWICYTFYIKRCKQSFAHIWEPGGHRSALRLLMATPRGWHSLSMAPCSQHLVRMAGYLHGLKWLYTLYYCFTIY